MLSFTLFQGINALLLIAATFLISRTAPTYCVAYFVGKNRWWQANPDRMILFIPILCFIMICFYFTINNNPSNTLAYVTNTAVSFSLLFTTAIFFWVNRYRFFSRVNEILDDIKPSEIESSNNKSSKYSTFESVFLKDGYINKLNDGLKNGKHLNDKRLLNFSKRPGTKYSLLLACLQKYNIITKDVSNRELIQLYKDYYQVELTEQFFGNIKNKLKENLLVSNEKEDIKLFSFIKDIAQ